ncbi:MAG: tetratricopeptide repeat protein [Prosthecobacter sp.]
MKLPLRVTLASLATCISVLGQAPKPPAPGAPPAAPGSPPAAPAAPGSLNIQQETEALMNEAVKLFTEAKYQEALSKIAQAEKNLNNKPFEGILYAKGACFFNLEEYAKAIESLELYVKEFPEGGSIIDVRMALGRAYIKSKQGDKGVTVLKEVVTKSPEKKAEAGLIIADHLKADNKTEEALQILSAVLADGVRSPESIQAAMMASQLYVASGKLEDASALMDKVRNFASGGDNIAQMNNIYLQLGDQMMEKKAFQDALNAYQLVRRKSEISRIQKEQIAKVEAKLKVSKGDQKAELETKLKAGQEILAEIEKRTDYDASLYYRLGRCYFEMGQPPTEGAAGDSSRMWQSILAFSTIVNEFKDFPQRDRCMYGLIMVNAALKRIPEARALCEKFIENFPDSSELGQISEMYGMLAYQNGQLEEAERAFNKAAGFPKADKERLRYLSGIVLFELQRFEQGRAAFEALIADSKDSVYKDECLYRIALSYFYQNDYKNVVKALETYIKENPKGNYLCDAKYRLAFITFQEGKKDKAQDMLIKITEEHPNDQNIGQVHGLLGDIYNQKADYENATKQFESAVDKAKTDDVLNYVMDQLTDLYVGQNEWKKLAGMWQRYYNTHKDNEELSLKAILWISRSHIKDQKPEEAQKLLSEHIKQRISSAANQQVEGLIQQLVNVVTPKRRRAPPAPTPDPTAKPAAVAAAPIPRVPEYEQPFDEVEKKLEALLTPPAELNNGTAAMRILFAKTWLAKAMKLSDKTSKFFNILIEVAKAEDLSPMLLALVGDNARTKGDLEKATACYTRLRDVFKNTEYSDGAPVGLAEIEFEKNNHDKALELFKAAGEFQGSAYILQATQGIAKTSAKLKKWDDAKKLYEQIAQTKEWRGEPTANALRMLGDVEASQNKHEAAIAYYQRVFIAHQRYKDEMAKAYLGSAKSFIALGKKEEARNTLQEMINRADLKEKAETKEAQRLIATL